MYVDGGNGTVEALCADSASRAGPTLPLNPLLISCDTRRVPERSSESDVAQLCGAGPRGSAHKEGLEFRDPCADSMRVPCGSLAGHSTRVPHTDGGSRCWTCVELL